MKYLLDTNIIIFFFKGKHAIEDTIGQIGIRNCFVSEITIAELLFGAYHSSDKNKHMLEIEELVNWIEIIPISSAIDFYAKEKSRLRKLGTPIDDFDLLIGATAFQNDLVLVTNNTKHFSRINKIKIVDWTK